MYFATIFKTAEIFEVYSIERFLGIMCYDINVSCGIVWLLKFSAEVNEFKLTMQKSPTKGDIFQMCKFLSNC